jgi:hypothetical protein
VNIVERLLMREEIDSLELDLARARDKGDADAVADIGACIARLEAALLVAYRDDVQMPPKDLDGSVRQAA